MLNRIDHIGIVVKSIEDSLKVFQDSMGLKLDRIEEAAGGKLRIAFLPVGETEIELLEPRDGSTMPGKFLESHGEGLHHICFNVDGIDARLEALNSKRIGLIDKKSRPGASGAKIAFLDPSSTSGALIELSEKLQNKAEENPNE